jgi:Protein of unknown function (DUF3145)
MSFLGHQVSGYGRIFVAEPETFGSVARVLSSVLPQVSPLNWVETFDSARAKHLSSSRRNQHVTVSRFGAEFDFDTAGDAVSRIASQLSNLGSVTFEVTAPCDANDLGQRFAFTPELGLFHGQIDHAGNLVVTEHQLQRVLSLFNQVGSTGVEIALVDCLGTAWDQSLGRDHEAFEFALERMKLVS